MFWAVVLLAVLLVSAAIFYTLLRVAARWGEEAIELKQYGVEVTGVVTERRSERRRGSHIRYEYVDQFGVRHRSRRNLVTPEAWDAHAEGGPIAVVYSQRNPRVSAPRYLLALTPEQGQSTKD
jgi:hypothetical protein